jgi:signal peptidase I
MQGDREVTVEQFDEIPSEPVPAHHDDAEPAPGTGLTVWREIKATVRDLVQFSMLAVLIVTFVVQPVKVEGSSMLPRLHDGERIFINKFLYSLDGWPSESFSLGRPVHRGDVVVFYYPNDPSKRYVKRVIGLPGDMVRIDDEGRVFVNGEQLEEPYLSDEYTRLPDAMPTTEVSAHHFFVMGDNRDNSSDSRKWGLVPEKYICGEAVFRFWPIGDLGLVE